VQPTVQSNSTAKRPPQPNGEQLIKLWLRQQPSENTRGAYARDVRRLFQFVEKSLDRLTALDLIKFSDHLLSTGLAPISRARTLTAVRSLLRFSHRAGVLAGRPVHLRSASGAVNPLPGASLPVPGPGRKIEAT